MTAQARCLAALATLTLAASLRAATIPGTSLQPAAWYEADEGVTVVSGAVSAWADKSGNGNTAAQGTAANRPLPVAKATPSRAPALLFDGTDFLNFSAPMLSQEWSVFAVLQPLANNDTQKSVIAGGTGSFQYRVRRSSEGGKQNITVRAKVPLANSNAMVPTNRFSLIDAVVRQSTSTSKSYAYRLDRLTDGGGTTTTNFYAAATALGGSETFKGVMAAVIVFTNALSTVEVAAVESYLHGQFLLPPPAPTAILIR